MALDDIVFEVEIEADSVVTIKPFINGATTADGVPVPVMVYVNTSVVPEGDYQQIFNDRSASSFFTTSICHARKVVLSLNDALSNPESIGINSDQSSNFEPLLLLTASVLDYRDGVASELPLAEQLKFISGMYRNLFKVAEEEGYDYVVLPAGGLGDMGGNPELYFGVLMALAKLEYPKLNIIYHPGAYANQFNQALEAIGCDNVVSIHKDVVDVAVRLRNKGYRCALHNPVHDDMVHDYTDLSLRFGSDLTIEDQRQAQSCSIKERNLKPHPLMKVESARLQKVIQRGGAGVVEFGRSQDYLGEGGYLEQDKFKFDRLFAAFRVKTDKLIEKGDPDHATFNPAYQKVALAAKDLYTNLTKARDVFFADPTERKRAAFKRYCEHAIRIADMDFAEHRGAWGKIHPILRKIIGFIAIMTVIPAIIVAIKSPHGCIETFFGNRVPDACETLRDFQKGVLGEKEVEQGQGCHATH